MRTLSDLIETYRESGVSRAEDRCANLYAFSQWLNDEGYEVVLRRTRAEAERQYAALLEQRADLDEKIDELVKELQQ